MKFTPLKRARQYMYIYIYIYIPYSFKFSRPFKFRAFNFRASNFRAPNNVFYSRTFIFRAAYEVSAPLIFAHPNFLVNCSTFKTDRGQTDE